MDSSRVKHRDNLAEHKIPYAHTLPKDVETKLRSLKKGMSHLEAIIRALKPTALIGVSAQGGAFTESVVKALVEVSKDIMVPKDENGNIAECSTSMDENQRCSEDSRAQGRIRPLLMALSNPTSKSECTAEQAYNWANGDIVFMSGSPFPPAVVSMSGEDRDKGDDQRSGDNTMTFEEGQANNAYIFPGLGLAMVSIHASSVTDLDFIVAAHALAETVSVEDLRRGRGFPPLSRLREVSLHIAAVTALHVAKEGRSLLPKHTFLLH